MSPNKRFAMKADHLLDKANSLYYQLPKYLRSVVDVESELADESEIYTDPDIIEEEEEDDE